MNIVERIIQFPNARFSIDESESIVRIFTNDTQILTIDIVRKTVCHGNFDPNHPLFAGLAEEIVENHDLLVAVARVYIKGFRYGALMYC